MQCQTYGYLPSCREHHLLTGTKLYCFVTDVYKGMNNLRTVVMQPYQDQESNPQPLDCKSNAQLVTSRPNHSKYNNHALCDCGLYCLLIYKWRSPLHCRCIHLQLQCSTQFKKVLFLDFANAKSLITSSKSTERSMSASMQSRDRESNLSWPIVVLHGFLILLSIVCKHWW